MWWVFILLGPPPFYLHAPRSSASREAIFRNTQRYVTVSEEIICHILPSILGSKGHEISYIIYRSHCVSNCPEVVYILQLEIGWIVCWPVPVFCLRPCLMMISTAWDSTHQLPRLHSRYSAPMHTRTEPRDRGWADGQKGEILSASSEENPTWMDSFTSGRRWCSILSDSTVYRQGKPRWGTIVRSVSGYWIPGKFQISCQQ